MTYFVSYYIILFIKIRRHTLVTLLQGPIWAIGQFGNLGTIGFNGKHVERNIIVGGENTMSTGLED